MDPTPTTDDTSPHSMRIASHGKISLLVAFALKFLKENPTRPLVLHTLPHKSGAAETETSEPDGSKRKIEPSTTNTARLISVAEIVKREFKEGPLHQYNEIGCLDSPNPREGGSGVGVPSEPGAERQAALQKVAEGKNHLPIKRTPYMKITLSRSQLSEVPNSTYQPPITKKQSRGTQKRTRGRVKKANTLVETKPTSTDGADEDAMDIVPA
ncbi:unnamed protein product [Rhizoctonia solani]|uniref:Uncharacterized protein n=1 Tax=Rhizoctonia solani TaxID=456999 RepID=A0A8H3E208_9AGAM|nr:unnamed protein product [Rhizoctonia solani]